MSTLQALDVVDAVSIGVADPVAYPNAWLCENGVALGDERSGDTVALVLVGTLMVLLDDAASGTEVLDPANASFCVVEKKLPADALLAEAELSMVP